MQYNKIAIYGFNGEEKRSNKKSGKKTLLVSKVSINITNKLACSQQNIEKSTYKHGDIYTQTYN